MMLNNPMHNNRTDPVSPGTDADKPSKPNETAGFAVQGFVKIFDPQTQETIVETRA